MFKRPGLCPAALFLRDLLARKIELVATLAIGPPLAGDRKSDIITSDRIAKAVAECLHETQSSVRLARHSIDIRCAGFWRTWRSFAASLGGRANPAAGLAACAVSVWRHQISGRIQKFRIRQPECATRRLVRQSAFGTFDNFNMVVSGVKGSIAAGTELFTETLTTPSLDEVSTEYGLLAEAVSFPEDHSNVTYRLRANARWHDGKPITADDVLFSFDALKKNSPFYGAYYRHVVNVEKIRRSRNQIYLRRARQPRAAADCRPTSGAAEALVGRHRQIRPQA